MKLKLSGYNTDFIKHFEKTQFIRKLMARLRYSREQTQETQPKQIFLISKRHCFVVENLTDLKILFVFTPYQLHM